MNSMEKFNKMISLEPYGNRTEIPVFPHMVATFPALAGMTQSECINDIDKWLASIVKTIEMIGKPDVCLPCSPGDTIFTMGLPARIPGREIGDNELYQFVEKPYFDDPAEYKKIYNMGWNEWNFQYMMSIQNPPMTNPGQLAERFGQVGQHYGKTIGFIYEHGMVPGFHTGVYPIYDNLSLIRSMAEFTCDIYENPGPIMDIINKYQPIQDEGTVKMMKENHMSTVAIFPMRSSAVFASPAMFAEYIWPALKASINRFAAADILCVIHADADWLPMLEHFTELPKGVCHIELDGATDIAAAYDILQGSQSIRGDVPSTLFAYGSEEDVQEYCEKLIQMGMKGGFMLGSGCEVPINAKPENVKAMIDMVR